MLAGCSEEITEKPEIVGMAPHRINKPYQGRPYTYKMPDSTSVKPYSPITTGKSLVGKVIIVDPGHGGRDPGAGQAGFSTVPEKTINLSIASTVASALRAKGANVIMTRSRDVFVELEDRAAIADRNKADLLVSIHADSHHDSKISGPTLYVARNASYTSRKVANSIHSTFKNSSIASRGVRKADFKVLANHKRPAVLVECGYLTNGYEARNLNSNWYRNKIAGCIAEAITKSIGN